VLILISDGGDNASKHNLSQVIEMAGVPRIIYAIGIFDEQDGDQNQTCSNDLQKKLRRSILPESSRN